MPLIAFNTDTLVFEAIPTTSTCDCGVAPGTTPAYSAGTNTLYEYNAESDSDNVLTKEGVRGGLFADYDCKGEKVVVTQINENQSTISGGGFRDGVFVNTVDSDTVDYTTIGQKVTNGVRSFTQGAHNGTAFQAQYKDLVGGYFAASGNIQWGARGVSAITADAYQYGSGIASNEMAVHNPSSANGGLSQSKSMAAVQAIIRSRYAPEDSTHVSRGVYISSNGERITNGIEMISDTSESYPSQYKYCLNMKGSVVTSAAIVMPQSASGNSGTVIEYDANDYTVFDRSGNKHMFVIGGSVPLSVTGNGINMGTVTAPASPQNGDMWFDGTSLKFRVGGVTKTVTLS